ncbi:glycosyltransferase family 2 protein [Flavobacterium sp. DGU38]|uniref:Glycosyltransferase family 2 protein n=1 Tax=Flavobacterium calami TaxID=3139144 RepID=A0ABU9IJP5_9FLAO
MTNNVMISIIIVNYNTKELLINCINSIYKETKEVDFEIIVVDNNSNDGSEYAIREKFKNVIFIQTGENLGFGRANNIGINKSGGKYLFLLNSDTILCNNSIKVFFDFYEKYDNKIGNIGAVGGELLQDDGKSRNHSSHYFPKMQDEFKIIWNAFISKISKSMILNTKKEAILEKNEKFKKVDYVTGADLFICKSKMIEVGCFDKKFFMYFEETDLQKRLIKMGFDNYLISGTEIIHYEGGSFNKKKSSIRTFMLDQSRFYYYKKHNNIIFYFFFRVLYFIITIPLFFDFSLNYSMRKKLLLLRLGYGSNIVE